MNRSPAKKNAKGTFLNGIWHCECVPALPAEHFQTKNGGQNHGRWFYTCQKSQPKRCKFFLWDDDAKVREEAAVLSNSRSETPPKTPTKSSRPRRLPTPPYPLYAPKTHESVAISSGERKPLSVANNESDFDWSASNDKALAEVAQTTVMGLPQTPRKTPRTSHFTSPGKGKRSHLEMLEISSDFSTSVSGDDVFNTPRSSQDANGLLSPVGTPLREKLQGRVPPLPNSNLAADALHILERNKLPAEVEKKLVELLNKHDLRTQGIVKGRDITRLALGSKEKKIAELEARIASLEAERESNRAVISHLKRDIVQISPSKSRRGGKPGLRICEH